MIFHGKGATIVSIGLPINIMELQGDRFFEFMGLKPPDSRDYWFKLHAGEKPIAKSTRLGV